MNKYKIELKQIFKKEVTVFAENEESAMNIIEQTYFKTNLLDDSCKELISVETKIIEKNNEKFEDNLMYLGENGVILEKEDIEYLENLTNEMEKNSEEIKAVLKEKNKRKSQNFF